MKIAPDLKFTKADFYRNIFTVYIDATYYCSTCLVKIMSPYRTHMQDWRILSINFTRDKLEDMDISLANIWFLVVRLEANTSNLYFSKGVFTKLTSYYENLEYW